MKNLLKNLLNNLVKNLMKNLMEIPIMKNLVKNLVKNPMKIPIMKNLTPMKIPMKNLTKNQLQFQKKNLEKKQKNYIRLFVKKWVGIQMVVII